jgi:LPS sulfotransferase NodH
VFAQGRTGSTLLVQLLDSHPSVVCDGEIFSPNRFGRIRHLDRHLRGSIGLASPRGKHYGFKVKPYQLTFHGVDVRTFLERRAAEGWNIVHLVRSNFVRHALSTTIAEQRGYAHADRGSEAAARELVSVYRLDAMQLVTDARGRCEMLRLETQALDGIRHHTVEYECDLLHTDAHQATADGVFRYLGLPPSPVSTRLARLSADDLTTRIANYDEVLAAVERSEFAGMLAAPSR